MKIVGSVKQLKNETSVGLTAREKQEPRRNQGQRSRHLGETRFDRGSKFVVACTLALGVRGHKPRRCEEIPLFFGYCTQYQKHYANDGEELERLDSSRNQKARVSKPTALNPEPVFGITSMSDRHPEEPGNDAKVTDEDGCLSRA